MTVSTANTGKASNSGIALHLACTAGHTCLVGYKDTFPVSPALCGSLPEAAGIFIEEWWSICCNLRRARSSFTFGMSAFKSHVSLSIFCIFPPSSACHLWACPNVLLKIRDMASAHVVKVQIEIQTTLAWHILEPKSSMNLKHCSFKVIYAYIDATLRTLLLTSESAYNQLILVSS